MPVGKRILKPHGTRAAIARHRRAKEPLCDLCRAAERERESARAAARRTEAADALAAVRNLRRTD